MVKNSSQKHGEDAAHPLVACMLLHLCSESHLGRSLSQSTTLHSNGCQHTAKEYVEKELMIAPLTQGGCKASCVMKQTVICRLTCSQVESLLRQGTCIRVYALIALLNAASRSISSRTFPVEKIAGFDKVVWLIFSPSILPKIQNAHTNSTF